MAWQTPKTDWVVNPKNPVPEDFNRIEGNIDFLKSDIETKKGTIVNALNTVGLETELTDTHAQIANKIVAANQGTKIYTPGTANITIPKGFHSGQGYVRGDVNLVPANIAEGKSIFGVVGSAKTEKIAYGSAPVNITEGNFKKAVVTGLAFTPRFVLGILSDNSHINMIRSSTFPQFDWGDFYVQKGSSAYFGPNQTDFATKIIDNGFEMFFYLYGGEVGTVNWVAIG